MTRVLSVLLFALLAGALFVIPPAEPARIAALRVPLLLDETIGPGEAALGDAILDSSAVRRNELGQLVLTLTGVRLVSPAYPARDLKIHGLARAALVSGLRRHAAERRDEHGRPRNDTLVVEGERMPAQDGAQVLVRLDAQGFALAFEPPGGAVLEARIAGWRPPERTALLPSLVTILIALLFRRPVLALFAGVWTAAFLMRLGADPPGAAASALARSLPDVASELLWPQLVDPHRLRILGFVLATISMVGVMTRSGGMRGMIDALARLAHDARRSQIAAWLTGLVVLFDDYASCILVGTTLRPLTDRFRVSREKLAYLVDSTAAPVAGLSLFSTWIAFEVGTFSAQLPAAGLSPLDGHAVLVETLPFRFYCILTLVLAGAIVLSGRDFGPMLAAERRARTTGKLVRDGGRAMLSDAATRLEPVPGVAARALRALLPLLLFVGLTLYEIVRGGDRARALLHGSASGLALSVVMALQAGLRGEIWRAALTSLRSMGVAVAILLLSWMIAAACDRLGTAPYLTARIGDHLAPELLPSILFLTSAMVAFATGTSWATMSILLPVVVGLAFNLGKDSALGGHLLMVMSIGAVLEGSIFGAHGSPVSDTTVLSSTASACDHVDHVRTQLPYALTAMLTALVVGYLPCAFSGRHPALALLAACGLMLMVLFGFGRKSEPTSAAQAGAR